MFSEKDEFLDSMAEYFTKYIFEAVGYEKDKEIPLEEIKKAISTATGE